jgi:hypothetical protein
LDAVAPREVAKNVRSSKMSTAAEAASSLTLFRTAEAVRFHNPAMSHSCLRGRARLSAVPNKSDGKPALAGVAPRGGEERALGEIVHSG